MQPPAVPIPAEISVPSVAPVPTVPAPKPVLLDRDHSILAFNRRVLDWARRPEVPLIERLRYLCIVSSNLDEFFEVRAAAHLIAATSGPAAGGASLDAFERLAETTHATVAEQYALYNDALMPAFAEHGLFL
ncbi:MAG TPA: polyphosphate kinase 1, partial [Variovorax sp.]|nr:polyphosphate kinase 1 [Variovorax sp.]